MNTTDDDKPMRSYGRARLLTLLLATVPLCGAALLATVKAQVGEQIMDFGRELGAHVQLQGYRHVIVVNGQRVQQATATSELPVSALLDGLEHLCGEHAVDPLGLLAAVPQSDRLALLQARPELGELGKLSVYRHESLTDGLLGCLSVSDDLRNRGPLLSRMRAALSSGDLAALGDMRFVQVTTKPNSEMRTVTVFWTQGTFEPFALFGDGVGDAPGTDSAHVPRPPSARRLLDAHVENTDYATRQYRSLLPPDAVLASYDEAMAADGWLPVTRVQASVPTARIYSRAGVDVLVAAERRGQRSVINVIELGKSQ